MRIMFNAKREVRIMRIMFNVKRGENHEDYV